jgi:esterase/lipase
MRGLYRYYLLLIIVGSVCVGCVDIEDLLVFANESGHVSEYHLQDSLTQIPDDQWRFIDNLGTIKTDAIWVKGDTAQRFKSGRKLVVFFNGRDVCLLSGVGIAKCFRSIGCDFFTIDYRGYGRSFGTIKNSEETVYEDGEAAIRYCTDSLGYNFSEILIAGWSLGGGVAVEMAKRHSETGVLLFATFTNMDNSVESIAGGYDVPSNWIMNARFDNLAKIDSISSSLCIISGNDDTFITPDQAKQLYEAAKEPKELHILEGQDHNRFVTDSYNQWKEIVRSFIVLNCFD